MYAQHAYYLEKLVDLWGRMFNKSTICIPLLLLLYSISITNLVAQPTKAWDKTFGGNEFETLRSIKQTADGGYVIGGSSQSDTNGDKSESCRGGYDYWVVKLHADGSKAWDKTFGGNAEDILNSIQQTTDGGYILGGYSSSNASEDKTDNAKGKNDYWIIKLNASGSKEWEKTIGGNNYDLLYSLQQTTDGGYILGGHSFSNVNEDKSENSKGGSDYWIIKLKPDGSKEWDKTIGGSGDDALYSLQQTTDGSFILGGYSNSNAGSDKSENSRGNLDYWVVKLNANGSKEWDKTYGGSEIDLLHYLQLTADNGFILGGYSDSNANGDKSENAKSSSDFWVVKLKADGSKEWDNTVGGNNADILRSLQQTTDGGYILGGDSRSDISGDKSENVIGGGQDYWVVKLSASGAKEWDKTIGGSGYEFMSSLIQNTDGNYILAGSSNSNLSEDKSENSKGSLDYWIVKLLGNECTKLTLGAITAPAVPVPVNTAISASVAFTGTKLENATWTWGDGHTSAGVLNSSTISGSHTYSTPGVYTVTLTIEDICNKIAESTFQYVVIYDPAGGFVTGGGWINSPAGGYAAEPAATGKANFGFVSKYQKGATVPTGNTEFEFKAAGMNFNSTAYEWLVIAGAKAKYKGEGTINGTGNYGFFLTAIDGQVSGSGSIDKFRIKIWDKVTGATVYDNNIDRADDAEPTTALGGGSIVIQNPKKSQRVTNQTEQAAVSSGLKTYPNPFQQKIIVEFSLEQDGDYSLDIYDLKGRLVKQLQTGKAKASNAIQAIWEAQASASGVYIIRLVTQNNVQHSRVIKD